ncbi:DoxX family protein [Streptomyces sp. NPDC050263]|uniref:DoxX family protein n=1 Tax=Streptomyces sp. NPDC050263 TaxID=3155037 RepID=UPI0034251416
MSGAEAFAVLLLRLVIGATMAVHGLNHWRGGGRIAGTAGWFESLGLRNGRLQAWMSVLTEIGAGVLLAAGPAAPSRSGSASRRRVGCSPPSGGPRSPRGPRGPKGREARET